MFKELQINSIIVIAQARNKKRLPILKNSSLYPILKFYRNISIKFFYDSSK